MTDRNRDPFHEWGDETLDEAWNTGYAQAIADVVAELRSVDAIFTLDDKKAKGWINFIQAADHIEHKFGAGEARVSEPSGDAHGEPPAPTPLGHDEIAWYCGESGVLGFTSLSPVEQWERICEILAWKGLSIVKTGKQTGEPYPTPSGEVCEWEYDKTENFVWEKSCGGYDWVRWGWKLDAEKVPPHCPNCGKPVKIKE